MCLPQLLPVADQGGVCCRRSRLYKGAVSGLHSEALPSALSASLYSSLPTHVLGKSEISSFHTPLLFHRIYPLMSSNSADTQMRMLLLQLLELCRVFLLFVFNPQSRVLGMEARSIFYSKPSI